MAKQSGLGDNLYVGGVNLSGDVGSVESIHGGVATLDVTGIDKLAVERIGGLRDGGVDFTTYFNPAVGASHKTLGLLPNADTLVTYCRGTGQGSPAASCLAKQIGYDGTRADDGAFTFKVSAVADGFGLEWGQLLTPGLRTDTTATSPSTGLDTLASAAFGAQVYVHLTAFTGTSVTITVQDSADNATFATVTGLATSALTVPGFSRLTTVNTATVRRYLRVITTGTFTNAVFAVNVVKNSVAGQVF